MQSLQELASKALFYKVILKNPNNKIEKKLYLIKVFYQTVINNLEKDYYMNNNRYYNRINIYEIAKDFLVVNILPYLKKIKIGNNRYILFYIFNKPIVCFGNLFLKITYDLDLINKFN